MATEREDGIHLKPQKCKLFKREVTFLGHVVLEVGYKLDPSSIKPVVALNDSVQGLSSKDGHMCPTYWFPKL